MLSQRGHRAQVSNTPKVTNEQMGLAMDLNPCFPPHASDTLLFSKTVQKSLLLAFDWILVYF